MPKKTKKSGQSREKEFLYSQLFRPISTTRHQVTMERIVCAIERLEMQIDINMVGRAEVMLIKTLKTWRRGGWCLTVGAIILIYGGRGGGVGKHGRSGGGHNLKKQRQTEGVGLVFSTLALKY